MAITSKVTTPLVRIFPVGPMQGPILLTDCMNSAADKLREQGWNIYTMQIVADGNHLTGFITYGTVQRGVNSDS